MVKNPHTHPYVVDLALLKSSKQFVPMNPELRPQTATPKSDDSFIFRHAVPISGRFGYPNITTRRCQRGAIAMFINKSPAIWLPNGYHIC